MKSVCMQSPAGRLCLFASNHGMQRIDFLDGDHEEGSTDHPILLQTVQELREYFSGTRREFTVPIDLSVGTPFQRQAWETLRSIPYGQTISYGSQAKAMGRPKAVRAVGGANGSNPLPILIPCHRVVSSTGKLHGFGGGVEVKRILLSIEGLDIRA